MEYLEGWMFFGPQYPGDLPCRPSHDVTLSSYTSIFALAHVVQVALVITTLAKVRTTPLVSPLSHKNTTSASRQTMTLGTFSHS